MLYNSKEIDKKNQKKNKQFVQFASSKYRHGIFTLMLIFKMTTIYYNNLQIKGLNLMLCMFIQ